MRRNQTKRRSAQMSAEALRRFVLRESEKLTGELEPIEDVSAEEVDADEYADTLVQDIDMYKAMQIKEARLRRAYKKMMSEARKVRKNKQIAKKRILRNLNK
jgi:hypothetical protein